MELHERLSFAQKARWAHLKDWPQGQRFCYTCDTFKLLEEFGKNVNSSLGHDSVCRACRKIKSKREYDASTQEYRIYHRAKGRAKREDVPFDLELSDIVIPPVCPVFCVEFVVGDTHLTPSIDRLEPDLGYIKGNVFIICNRANRLKNDAKFDELLKIVEYVRKYKEGDYTSSK